MGYLAGRTGELGRSYYTNRGIRTIFFRNSEYLKLALAAMLLLALRNRLGTLAAVKRGTAWDRW
jgi:ABC-type dipeptide/oligopeptide/nickel transport system permease component